MLGLRLVSRSLCEKRMSNSQYMLNNQGMFLQHFLFLNLESSQCNLPINEQTIESRKGIEIVLGATGF